MRFEQQDTQEPAWSQRAHAGSFTAWKPFRMTLLAS